MGWRVRRGRLHALFWNGRRGAIAKAVFVLTPIWKFLGAGWRDERGSVAPMMALLGTALIGSAALAVDVSIWEGNVGVMQGAADQAALAAGWAMSAGTDAAKNEAMGVAAAHGFVVSQTKGVSVLPTIDPDTNVITVVIKQLQTTFLSGLSLTSPPTASVRAVATPGAGNTCILVLAPTGTGITVNDHSGINASNCSIYVNSKDACDMSVSGIATVTAYDIFLGEQSETGCYDPRATVNATHTGKVTTSAAAVHDPYASRTIPSPAPCTKLTLPPRGTVTLTHGTYCDLTVSGQQYVNLSPGVYIFDGGNVSASGTGQISGSDVTLVLTASSGKSPGSVLVADQAIMTLTPTTPTSENTSAATPGIAIWLDKAGTGSITTSGNAKLTVTGAIYAPASTIVWSGSGSSPCLQLIVYRVTLSGIATAGFKHDGCPDLGTADVASAAGYKLSE